MSLLQRMKDREVNVIFPSRQVSTVAEGTAGVSSEGQVDAAKPLCLKRQPQDGEPGKGQLHTHCSVEELR